MCYIKRKRGIYIMSSTPEYTRKAVDNYRKKFDVMQLRLPKGTKEIIDNKVGKANAHNFVVDCVLKALEPTQETQTEQKTQPVEEVPQEQQKDEPNNEEKDSSKTLEDIQAIINAKKAKQDREKEESEKRKKEMERLESEERRKEIIDIVEKLKNGEKLEEDVEKAQARIESVIKGNSNYI